ncbi:uncharacterized protein LOC110052531 [Orbicella faveolata]|uniref:uncharacterized protein LOC110052531 n=1 Tax=Orbicella faveolata TaxID=48498 RepID=UPI0009E499D4|nr:uncharacterized protein LOC110052531 [Orbicella faveolata]
MERPKAGSRGIHARHARADVNNMADLATQICNIPPTFFLDFLSSEEEDTLFMNDAEDEFVFFSIMCIFSRRKLVRIAHYFENTVPRYHCDGFRSHFRMTSSTFELLAQLLSPSEHIPKGNAFGRRPIEARKQIAVTVWALANQETCCQISDRFDITMSSVSRCIGRVVRALVDVRIDLIQWPEVTL